MTHTKFASITVVVSLVCAPVFAQQLNFDNLPGVEPQQEPAVTFNDNTAETQPVCTTAFEAFGTESNIPKRVYKCTQGNITITSENPPPSN